MMQATHPKTPIPKQSEPFVLALDAALLTSEDQKLIEEIKKITQNGVKLVVVGKMTEQMQMKFRSTPIEIISLEDLKTNKNMYSRGKTYCFMNDTCHVKDRMKIKENFPDYVMLAAKEKLNDCEQWKIFCTRFGAKTVPAQKSLTLQNKQSALINSGHGLFAVVPVPVITGAQAVNKTTAPPPMRQRPAAPIVPPGVAHPHLYFTSKCLAIALGKSDCKDTNLPEISLTIEGCLTIKLKKELVKDLKQNQLLHKNFKLDQSGHLIGKFKNVDALSNMLRPYGFNFVQGNGDYLRVILLKFEDIANFTPEQCMLSCAIENKLETSTLIRFCSVETSVFSNTETVSFYLYESLEEAKYQFIKLDNIEDGLSKLKLEEGGQRIIYVSPTENSLIYREITSKKQQPYQVNFENLYSDLCAKEGRDFIGIWNRVKQAEKYPEKCKVGSLLCQKLSANQYKDTNMIDLSLDAEGCLQMKVHQDIANILFQDTYLTKIFEPGEDGIASAKFKNIAALKEMLDYCQIGEGNLDLKNLYQELCDKDGRNFEMVWENVNKKSFLDMVF